MGLSLEDLPKLVKELQDGRADQERMRLTLLTLQQAVVEMLDQTTKQAPMLANAVREGLAQVRIPAAQVKVVPMPATTEKPEPQERCSWRAGSMEYNPNGSLKSFSLEPQPNSAASGKGARP